MRGVCVCRCCGSFLASLSATDTDSFTIFFFFFFFFCDSPPLSSFSVLSSPQFRLVSTICPVPFVFPPPTLCSTYLLASRHLGYLASSLSFSRRRRLGLIHTYIPPPTSHLPPPTSPPHCLLGHIVPRLFAHQPSIIYKPSLPRASFVSLPTHYYLPASVYYSTSYV